MSSSLYVGRRADVIPPGPRIQWYKLYDSIWLLVYNIITCCSDVFYGNPCSYLGVWDEDVLTHSGIPRRLTKGVHLGESTTHQDTASYILAGMFLLLLPLPAIL